MTARSLIALALLCTGCGSPGADVSEEDASLPLCAWCGADEAPEGLDWDMTIAGPGEDGERLVGQLSIQLRHHACIDILSVAQHF